MCIRDSPYRGPLCAGEALLEAKASVALFKLGAHSATLGKNKRLHV